MDVRRHVTAGRLSELFGERRPRDRQGDPHDGLAPGRRAGAAAARARDPAVPAGLRRRRERLPRPADSPARDRRSSTPCSALQRPRLPGRGLDAGRLAGLAQGDGLGPARQLRRRDRPGLACRATTRPSSRSPSSTRAYPTTGTSRSSSRARSSTASSSRTRPAGGDPQPARPPRSAGRRRRRSTGARARSTRMPRRCSAAATASAPTRWVVDGDHSDDRQAAAGQRPAPRRSACPGIWYQMGLHCTHASRRLPVRRRRLHLLRRARRGHRPQRRDRLGLHQPRPRRHRPLPRAGHGRHLPARRRSWRRSSTRTGDDQGRRRRRRAAHRPLDRARPAALRRRRGRSPTSARTAPRRAAGAAAATRYAVSLAVDRRCTPGTHRRRDLRARPRHGLGPSSAAAARDFAVPGAEPRLRRPRRPHRLPGARAGSRSGSPATTGAPARLLAGARLGPQYDWKGYVPFDAAAERARPRRGLHRHRQPGRHRPATTPTSSPTDWDYGYRAPADPRRCSQRDAEGLAPTTCRRSSSTPATRFAPDARRPTCSRIAGLDVLHRAGPAAAARLGLQPADRQSRPAAAAYYNAVWRNLLELTFHDELPGGHHGPTAAAGGSQVVSNLLHRTRTTRGGTTSTTPGVIESPRRDPATGDGRGPRRADPRARQGPATTGSWGQPAPARPAAPGARRRVAVPGRSVAVQPRAGTRSAAAARSSTPTAWDAEPGLRRSTGRRRCGWWSTSPTSTRSRWVNLTGVSGHAFDAHYADQVDAWVKGETYAWPFTEKAVRKAETDELRLVPDRSDA